MLRHLKTLPSVVWLIGLISLLNDSASEMLYPVIPLYLSSVLLAGPKAMGLIEGIAEATASLLKLFSGVVVDRTRRSKPWIVLGYGVAGLGRPLMALVASWPWLLLLRFTDRLGKGVRTSPRDAMLAESVEPAQRGLAFGVHRAMDNAGAVIGPLLAAALLGAHVPLRDIFLWAALPAALCLLLTLLLKEPAAPAVSAREPLNWQLTDLPLAFRRYLVVVGMFALGNSSNMFLLLRARELGVSAAHVPLLWAGVSAVAMLLSAPLSGLSDKVGRIRLLLLGYSAYGLVYLLMGNLVSANMELYVLFACYGIFLAATEGVEKALVADLAPTPRRGTAFGWFNLVAGVALLPASLLFGWLYQSFSPLLAFGFSGGCALMAGLLLAFWVRPVLPQFSGTPG
ncbi:MFS transporter [Paludibacterium denitrificans]|uniref:MFS transporter n=1 Tax=Paludibacterium denitrificans TaxID=2675226 RepID=A0A844GBG4_9NEIS|nr:MFS transporter [Paludibacterium denitrificans]MTD32578.1 MFS transporter [Paludibacterium denitrificans]HJV06679.1 MFS transporter [Chromobacteriaceae bacterium]